MFVGANASVEVDGVFKTTKSKTSASNGIVINNNAIAPFNPLPSQGMLWTTNTYPNNVVFRDNSGSDHIISGNGVGTISQINTGEGLIGGPITTTGTLSIEPAGVTNSMLKNSSIMINAGPGLSGGGTVALGGSITLEATGVSPPSVTHNIYVAVYGNDTTGNGSLLSPFGSLTRAISVANVLASTSNPVTVIVSSGVYIEDNSSGPITISSSGITITGYSPISVIFTCTDPSNDFLVTNSTISITGITIESQLPNSRGVVLSSGALSDISNVRIIGFDVGLSCGGSTTDAFTISNCLFVANNTGISITGGSTGINETVILGTAIGGNPSNSGISMTGASTLVIISGGTIATCVNGIIITDNSSASINALTFKLNIFDVFQTSSSSMTLTSCTFELTDGPGDVDIQISGPGTQAQLIGCEFNGKSTLGIPEATGILITDSAFVNISSGTMHDYTNGIRVGTSSDTSSTHLSVSGLIIKNCTTDLVQNGTTTIQYNSGVLSSSKVTISDPTNVQFSYFDLDNNSAITIGSTDDVNTTLFQVDISSKPSIEYNPSIYGTKAIGYEIDSSNIPTSFYSTSFDNSGLISVTQDRTKSSSLQLISDTASPIGTNSALRGWNITKTGSDSSLIFGYQNTDVVGQTLISEHNLLTLDGVFDTVDITPIDAKLTFAGDSNLYRSGINLLKTDSNFIIQPLTPGKVVITDANTNQLSSASVTNTELSYLSGVTSPLQTQINSKVSKSGDVLIGNLTLPTLNATNVSSDAINSTTLSSTTATIPTLSSTTATITTANVGSLQVQNEQGTGNITSGSINVNTTLSFKDSGTNYLSLQAPTTLLSSYTLSLPATIPTSGQLLRAGEITPTSLEWITSGGITVPSSSRTIFVTKYGNDGTGDGSFDFPFASLSKAISTANTISTASNPVTIEISSGLYIENNSAGPLSVTADGISIVGVSRVGVIFVANTPTNDFLTVTNPILIGNITFESSSPLATCLTLSAGSLSAVEDVRIFGFLIGVNCIGVATNSYGFNLCTLISNATAIAVNNAYINCNGCVIFGSESLTGPPANSGISISGSSSNVIISGGIIGVCVTGMQISNNALVSVDGTSLRLNQFDVIQDSASTTIFSSCIFEQSTSTLDIDFQISGAGTKASLIACKFSGLSSSNVKQGLCIKITAGALITMCAGKIQDYDIGIQIGIPSDTSSTGFTTNGVSLHGNVTHDVLQQGSSMLSFNGGGADGSKISISDPTNVQLFFNDADNNSSLLIGASSNVNIPVFELFTSPTQKPYFSYVPNIYSFAALGYTNSTNAASTFVNSISDAENAVITSDRTKTSVMRLISDTNAPVGSNIALRGWDILKEGTTGNLNFSYQNTDIVGQNTIVPHNVLVLDGVNNQVQTPSNVEYLLGGDTNLYRSGSGVLKTDGTIIVGTLTPGTVVITNASTNQLSSSAVTNTELSYLSGTTSSVQTQINSKVSKTGDTMTGTLQIPSGTTTTPSLTFTGSTTSGLSCSSNVLSLTTSSQERMKVDASGNITVNAFGTSGVLHNNSLGLLSSSLIVNSDITDGAITNTKLSSISSSDVSGNIVVRDGSGNFSTNAITLDGAITNSTQAVTKAYVDAAVSTGLVAKNPANAVSTSNLTISGVQTIDGVNLSASDRVLTTGQTNAIENGLWVVNVGAWTRPTDFASGSTAGQAYILILSGTVYQGSSWLCSTPTAVIDTNSIQFSLFSLPDTTSAVNTGVGTGMIFKNKTGTTLNLRTLLQDTHVTLVSGTDEITVGTDATSTNSPSTIVSRDASGNFSAGNITATVTGASSLNVLKSGDTMTGVLQLPTGTTSSPSLTFTGSSGTGISATSNTLSLSTSSSERVNISPTGRITLSNLSLQGVVHCDSSGLLSSSLITNSDIIANASIDDSKLAAITTSGKIANSATTATSSNVASSIVSRDASGNFNAGTIIATLQGSATNNVLKSGDTMTGILQLPIGNSSAPSLTFTGSLGTGLSSSVGGLSLNTNGTERLHLTSGGSISVNAFTSAGIVHNDNSGNLTSSLITNSDISSSAAIVDSKLATITTSGKVSNSATSATSSNVDATIVMRDASGNFSANTITANLVGNASTANTATSSTNFSGNLSGDVTGTQTSTVVTTVGGITSANIATGVNLANNSTPSNTVSTIVRRDISGNFNAGTITATLSGNASTATFATSAGSTTNFSGTLSGDVTGTQSSTVVSTVGGLSSATIASGASLANTATATNTPSTVVLRDASGNFNAGVIAATLQGSATNNVLKTGDTMTGTLQLPAGSQTAPSLTFTGSSGTGLSATSGGLSLITNNTTRIGIASGGAVSIPAFATTGVVHNDSLGNLTTSLIVNSDISSAAAIIDSKLSTISTAGKVLNSATTATASNVVSTIVARDGSGNFTTTMITLSGTTTNATDAATKSYVDSVAGGVSTNTPNTTVFRDSTGSFAAQNVTMVNASVSGNVDLTTNPSTSTNGNIFKNGNRFIHNTGTNNLFSGVNSGNFTITGSGQNSVYGSTAMSAVTTGANNTTVGYNGLSSLTSGSSNISIGSSAGGTLTIGSGNIYIDANSSSVDENTTIRIGTAQTRCFIAGIKGAVTGGGSTQPVIIDQFGQLGTTKSSARYKENIQKMKSRNVLGLEPKEFNYIADPAKRKHFGLIAEEVNIVCPELVVHDKDGVIESVAYHDLPVLLLKELKKQRKLIEKLMKEVEYLKLDRGRPF